MVPVLAMSRLLWLILAFPSALLAAELPLKYDHYDPLVLSEYAKAEISEGHLGAARIMLERAALLAPENPMILRNLRRLREQMAAGAEKTPAASASLPAVPTNASQAPATRPVARVARWTPSRAAAVRQVGADANVPEPPALWR